MRSRRFRFVANIDPYFILPPVTRHGSIHLPPREPETNSRAPENVALRPERRLSLRIGGPSPTYGPTSTDHAARTMPRLHATADALRAVPCRSVQARARLRSLASRNDARPIGKCVLGAVTTRKQLRCARQGETGCRASSTWHRSDEDAATLASHGALQAGSRAVPMTAGALLQTPSTLNRHARLPVAQASASRAPFGGDVGGCAPVGR